MVCGHSPRLPFHAVGGRGVRKAEFRCAGELTDAPWADAGQVNGVTPRPGTLHIFHGVTWISTHVVSIKTLL